MQNKSMSFKQYRNIDLFIFAVLLVVFELIIFKAATKWYPDQLYTVSLVPALVSIIIMRWNYFGLIHALLGGLVYAYLAQGTVLQFMCYVGGNIFCVFAIILLLFIGKEKIRQNSVLSVLFAVLVALLMQIGRAVVALLMGNAFALGVNFITTDVLSGVFAAVIVIIARKLDGLFEDQKTYLLRVQEESKEEWGRN